MPSEAMHEDKKIDAYKIYQLINKSGSSIDWESILLFYASLHCVDKFFASLPEPIHPRSHEFRNKLVSMHLRSYAEDYLYAHQISMWARYDDTIITSTMRDGCKKNYDNLAQIA